MKAGFWSRPILGAVLLGGCALLAGPVVAEAENQVVITGDVEAADYDDDGNVAAVAIFDNTRGSVLVSREGKGKELLKHVGSVVKATGSIEELDDDTEFTYKITVTSFKVLEPVPGDDDPEWDPDDED